MDMVGVLLDFGLQNCEKGLSSPFIESATALVLRDVPATVLGLDCRLSV